MHARRPASSRAYAKCLVSEAVSDTLHPGGEPIVVAYSGGLDTSFLVPWIRERYGRPVITVTVDTGGIEANAARTLEERARGLGIDATGIYRHGDHRPAVAFANPRHEKRGVEPSGVGDDDGLAARM